MTDTSSKSTQYKTSNLVPLGSKPTLSVCIPAYNEEENIGPTIDTIAEHLEHEGIPYEFVIANDNSSDRTEDKIAERMQRGIPIRIVRRNPPGGFGRALRSCLEHFKGDIIAIVMADLSDDPKDLIRYYHKINEGYDAVFGSRFMLGSVVRDYPLIKLVANRVGNKLIQLLFRTRHNDLTNAFKAYRAEVVRSLMPFYSSHFNLTIEMSLAVLTRDFKIAAIPINWYGRTWGCANFKIRELGRRYFATLIKAYAERIFIMDDVLAEHQKRLDGVVTPASTEDTIISNIDDEEDLDHGRSRVRGL